MRVTLPPLCIFCCCFTYGGGGGGGEDASETAGGAIMWGYEEEDTKYVGEMSGMSTGLNVVSRKR